MNKPLSSDDIAATRARILAVATRLFAEEGAAVVTMRRLAAELGMSRTTPYSYFRDKAEIVDCIRVIALDRLTQAYREAIDAETHPLAKMAALARAYVRFALDEPNAYRVLFDLREHLNEVGPEVIEAVRRFSEVGLAPMRACVEQGLLRGPVEEVNLVTWSCLHGLVSLHLSGRLPPGQSAENLLPLMLEMMGRGLIPNGE